MPEAKTIPAKYIFLDVVGFTKNRSVEAQTDIIAKLNEIVRIRLEEARIPEDNRIFLPTGDGLCIALLGIQEPYNIDLLIALNILEKLHEHNEATEDVMRQFDVRIGLNENVDNLVIDINGNQNVAGAGINMAQRVMSQADGGQIVVGQSVYEKLCHREQYMKSFQPYTAQLKHAVTSHVYHYIAMGHLGLTVTPPTKLFIPTKTEPKLTRFVAYYFAHAIMLEAFFTDFLKREGLFAPYGCALFLWFAAVDSLNEFESQPFQKPTPRLYGKAETPIETIINHYNSIDYWAKEMLFRCIIGKLSPYHKYFEGYDTTSFRSLIADTGKSKLKNEFPDIWKEFGLAKSA